MELARPIASWSVYYDGLCPLCSREINHYRKQKGADHLRFVDITGSGFSPAEENVDPVQVHKVMHVKDPAGKLHTGVDAFIAIWGILPRYSFAAAMARKSFVKLFLNAGYAIFARVRPYLPRKNAADCEASPYCERKAK